MEVNGKDLGALIASQVGKDKVEDLASAIAKAISLSGKTPSEYSNCKLVISKNLFIHNCNTDELDNLLLDSEDIINGITIKPLHENVLTVEDLLDIDNNWIEEEVFDNFDEIVEFFPESSTGDGIDLDELPYDTEVTWVD